MKNKDINIKIDDYTLNCRSVAIIINNNQILFQKKEKDKYWALPGGKISLGETTVTALERELKEELGLTNYKVESPILIAEHFFNFNQEKVHQYIFGHLVLLDTKEYIFNTNEFKGIEKDKDIIFKWINMNDLTNTKIKPDFLITELINIDKKEIKFISYKEL